MNRQEREGGINVRDPHKVVLTQEPRDLRIAVHLVTQRLHLSLVDGPIEARPTVVRDWSVRPRLKRTLRNRAHRKDDTGRAACPELIRQTCIPLSQVECLTSGNPLGQRLGDGVLRPKGGLVVFEPAMPVEARDIDPEFEAVAQAVINEGSVAGVTHPVLTARCITGTKLSKRMPKPGSSQA